MSTQEETQSDALVRLCMDQSQDPESSEHEPSAGDALFDLLNAVAEEQDAAERHRQEQEPGFNDWAKFIKVKAEAPLVNRARHNPPKRSPSLLPKRSELDESSSSPTYFADAWDRSESPEGSTRSSSPGEVTEMNFPPKSARTRKLRIEEMMAIRTRRAQNNRHKPLSQRVTESRK